MDTKDTDVRRTGSWLPFYCWLAGAIVVGVLTWLFPDHHNRGLAENVLDFLLGILFIFLFFMGPAWMLVSSVLYWRAKDYARAVIGALLALTIFLMFLQGTTL